MTDSKPPRDTFTTKLWRTLRLDLALRFIWRSTPGWTVASAALVVVQGVLPLASLYLLKLLVDSVTASVGAADQGAAFNRVLLYVVLMAAFSLLSTVVGLVAGIVSQTQAMVVTDYMQDIVHAKSVAIDLEFYESAEFYDTLRRAQGEASMRPMRILQGLLQLGRDAVSLLAISGLLLAFNGVFVVVLLAAVAPGFIVRIWYSGTLYRWQRKRTATERKTWYYTWMLTGEQHAKEIRLFGLGDLFMDRFRDLRMRLRFERLQLARRQALFSFVAQLASNVAIYGAYGFIAHRALSGAISLGDLVMAFQAFQRGQGYLQSALQSLAGLYEDNLFIADLDEFLSLEPRAVTPQNPRPFPRPLTRGVAFEGVSFTYPGGKRQALHDITLTIRPGEKIALVGENGSGKTTLIKLLCRLYDPTEGRITLDGIDLRDLALADLRRAISVIMQDYVQYNLTVEDNIWFGNVSAPPDRAHIARVAHESGAHEVIARLPREYETVLGKMFQDGEQLSIGEWQKIALARAFLRDTEIIILDEPTSALDARAEYEVFRKLHALAEGQTAIMISHRFSTVRTADRIVVLDGGRIVEHGPHEALMRQGGQYAHLFTLQASQYT
ncbi:MAG: ABC transporter ATP-binding protein/permease [Anaerolineae bacterium]|nr:ABC transporter ATP-binding protein/permease [Anaerolineae bacterium]